VREKGEKKEERESDTSRERRKRGRGGGRSKKRKKGVPSPVCYHLFSSFDEGIGGSKRRKESIRREGADSFSSIFSLKTLGMGQREEI